MQTQQKWQIPHIFYFVFSSLSILATVSIFNILHWERETYPNFRQNPYFPYNFPNNSFFPKFFPEIPRFVENKHPCN